MSESDTRDLVAEIMRDTRIAVLTYVDDAGRLVSAPMGTQDFEDPGTVWFITEVDTDKVRAIEARPEVNVSYASGKGWVSLSGTARLNRDRAKLEELWDASVSAFMTGDAQDPANALLEVDGHTAQCWESPSKPGLAIRMVKGLLSKDDAVQEGDAPVVDL